MLNVNIEITARKVVAKVNSPGGIIAYVSNGKVVPIHQSESAEVLKSLVTGSVIKKTDLAIRSSTSSTKYCQQNFS